MEEVWCVVIPDNHLDVTLEVSNLGNVKYKGVTLIPNLTHGYRRVLIRHNGGRMGFFVHRLMVQAFLNAGKPLGKLQTNHKDGIKLHNDLQNLELVTAKQNIRHAYKLNLIDRIGNGKSNPGEACGGSKLKNEDVLKIREIAATTKRSYASLGREFNVTAVNIASIVNRVTWKHI